MDSNSNAAGFSADNPGFDEAEWLARQELACAYRLFDHFGWHECSF